MANSTDSAHGKLLYLKHLAPLPIHQYGPQMRRTVIGGALMLIPNSLQEAAIKNPVIRSKQCLLGELAQFFAKPAIQRNRKTLLSTLENFRRNLACNGFLENVLACLAVKLKGRRNCGGPLH